MKVEIEKRATGSFIRNVGFGLFLQFLKTLLQIQTFFGNFRDSLLYKKRLMGFLEESPFGFLNFRPWGV